MAAKQTYGNESITSLKGADRVRKRPAVIFGSDGLEEPITRADAAKMLSAARTLLDGEEPSGIFSWLK